VAMTLVAEDVAVSRGGRRVIERISFAVPSGSSLIVTGPNGAGKTTLLRAIAGLSRPESGAVRLDGDGEDTDIGERCHFLGHLNAVRASLTVRDNLNFWQRYLGDRVSGEANSAAYLTAALARLGLSDLASVPVGYLSAGQRRRAGLARLLVASRPVWLLDEPTASLDAASAAILVEIANAHLADGGIIVAATHLPLAFERRQDLRLGVSAEVA
jgi:heme exporter protein A